MNKYSLSIGYGVIVCLLCFLGAMDSHNAVTHFIIDNILFMTIAAVFVGLYFMTYFLRRLFEKTLNLRDSFINIGILLAVMFIVFVFFKSCADLNG